ncbi:MAG: hypothetical protein ABSG85_18245 [Spirochaetia bacterium]
MAIVRRLVSAIKQSTVLASTSILSNGFAEILILHRRRFLRLRLPLETGIRQAKEGNLTESNEVNLDFLLAVKVDSPDADTILSLDEPNALHHFFGPRGLRPPRTFTFALGFFFPISILAF